MIVFVLGVLVGSIITSIILFLIFGRRCGSMTVVDNGKKLVYSLIVSPDVGKFYKRIIVWFDVRLLDKKQRRLVYDTFSFFS